MKFGALKRQIEDKNSSHANKDIVFVNHNPITKTDDRIEGAEVSFEFPEKVNEVHVRVDKTKKP